MQNANLKKQNAKYPFVFKSFITYCLLFVVCSFTSEDYVEYTFNYTSDNATEIKIEGDFTGWNRVSMDKVGKIWSKTFKLKKNTMYEYRFLVDGKPEMDPENKNKSVSKNTSVLFLDEVAKNKVIGKENIDVYLMQQTINELVLNQKKLLEELSLIRGELTKKDLQIELLRTQIDKFNIENKDKQKTCETIKLQYDQLMKNFEDSQVQIKKIQNDANTLGKELKLKQRYYADCIKTNLELKKGLKKLVKRQKTETKKVSQTKPETLQISESTKINVNKNTQDLKQQPSYTKVGKIYEVSNTTDIAIIFVGENSNLSKADMLYVLKNNDVIATLTVTSVENDWCYAKVVSGSKDTIVKQDVYIISILDETKNKSR